MILARAFDLLGGLALETDTAVWVVALIIELALIVLLVAAEWIIYRKAGQPGWAVLVPFYNYIVGLRIIGRPWWWMILLFIPLVNLVIGIIVLLDLATSFGKSLLFAIGLIFLAPVFVLILAFGDAEYVGPGGKSGQTVRRLSAY